MDASVVSRTANAQFLFDTFSFRCQRVVCTVNTVIANHVTDIFYPMLNFLSRSEFLHAFAASANEWTAEIVKIRPFLIRIVSFFEVKTDFAIYNIFLIYESNDTSKTAANKLPKLIFICYSLPRKLPFFYAFVPNFLPFYFAYEFTRIWNRILITLFNIFISSTFFFVS